MAMRPHNRLRESAGRVPRTSSLPREVRAAGLGAAFPPLAGCADDSWAQRRSLLTPRKGIRVTPTARSFDTPMREAPQFIVIRHYFNPFEAQLTCATLEAAGIDVLLQNENFVNTVWTEAIAVGRDRVLVPEESVSEAEAILGQSTHVLAEDVPDSTPSAQPAPSSPKYRSSCPACASSNLEFFVPLRRLAAALSIVGLPLVPPLKRYRCKTCGHVFHRREPA